MSVKTVIQIGDPVLRKKSKKVLPQKIASASIQQVIQNLIDTMQAEGGVGIAAPQVGELFQIIVVEEFQKEESNQKDSQIQVWINPRIIKKSSKVKEDWEGCLSVGEGNLRGTVPRSTNITVEAYNAKGKKQRFNAQDFYARVVQHEIDHLNGILFPDRMKDLTSLTTKENLSKQASAPQFVVVH